VKKTTGPAFDPAEEFVYFLATGPARHGEAAAALPDENLCEYPFILIAVNEMETPKAFEQVDKLIDSGRRILIDSGVFNLAMRHKVKHGVSHDVALSMPPEEIDGFEELLERYYTVGARYRDSVWGMIEIDLGGAAHKPRTRARIEKESGIIPMPVWHPLLDGIDYYHQLVGGKNGYDRICVGNLVQAAPTVRTRMLSVIAELSQQYPKVWHHLLGVTPNEITYSIPIYGSSDSSTWLAGVRWPQGWASRSMGKPVGKFGSRWWYEKQSYYRVDGVAFQEAMTVQENVRHHQRQVASW
jgi:hypothetical protein